MRECFLSAHRGDIRFEPPTGTFVATGSLGNAQVTPVIVRHPAFLVSACPTRDWPRIRPTLLPTATFSESPGRRGILMASPWRRSPL